MKKGVFTAGVAAACIALLTGCGLFGGDEPEGPVQGDANKPTQLTDAYGESVDSSGDLPKIEGLNLQEPSSAMSAEVQLCNAGKYWLQSEASKDDRSELAPWMLHVANEYQDDIPDVASASKVLIQMGMEVEGELNRGQDSFRRACGISMNEVS